MTYRNRKLLDLAHDMPCMATGNIVLKNATEQVENHEGKRVKSFRRNNQEDIWQINQQKIKSADIRNAIVEQYICTRPALRCRCTVAHSASNGLQVLMIFLMCRSRY